MKKALYLFVVSSVLAACGGGEATSTSSSSGSTNPTSSGSTSSGSTSSGSTSSGSTSSSSSSSSSGFQQPPSNGDPVAGKAIMEGANCSTCHVDQGQGSQGIYGGLAPINVNNWSYPSSPSYAGRGYTGNSESDLINFLLAEMPTNEPASCGQTCATDVAAYLWGLRSSTPTVPPVDNGVACDTSDPVFYGQRGMKLLTSYEYHNSLQALFSQNLPDDFSSVSRASSDANIARLPNHKNIEVNESRLTLYDNNATDLAAWAISNTDALPFSCSALNTSSCADKFINNFAAIAFRRPLTSQEKSDLTNMITSGFTPSKGMEWAIRSVLSSADFLYRFELGKTVSDVRQNGYGLPSASFGSSSGVGSGGTQIEAEDYSSESGTMLEDTMDSGGGLNVGYIDTGDFLEYDINVESGGDYVITYRFASQDGGGRIQVNANGNVGELDLPATGDWQNWESANHTVTLPEGNISLRLNAASGGYNLNWIRLEPVGSSGGGQRIEAESYASMNGVQLETTEDTGGGENVGYIDDGDFMQYNVQVPEAGIYRVSYRVASQDGGGRIQLDSNGNVGELNVPATGAWQNWETIDHQVNLNGGNISLRINAATGGFNLNWFELTLLGSDSGGAEVGNSFTKLQEAEGGAYVLDPYEYASALSYMYTASSPDVELLQAAASGALDDLSEVEAQIDRMINSPLGREQVKRFVGKWLKTDGVQAVNRNNSDFDANVKESMAEEVRRLYEHVFYESSVPFNDLYAANYTFLDSTLSDYYGIPGGGNGHLSFNRVPTSDRGGVIASGAFMAFFAHQDETAPIIRSVNLRQNMLCQEVPPPPKLGESGSDRDANLVQVQQLEAAGELTTTERYDLLTKAEGCGDCHNEIINPLFGMDDFDNAGLRRKQVNGQSVQTGLGPSGQPDVIIDWVNNGVLYGVNSIADVAFEANTGGGIHFNGAKDLSEKMAYEPATESCFIQRAFRFATGYPLNEAADTDGDRDYTTQQKSHFACVTNEVQNVFDSTNKSPYELYKAFGLSDVVRFRK